MRRLMDARGLAERRQALLADLSGRVIEVGAGDGANISWYPPGVSSVLAIEPEPRLRAVAARAAQDASVSVDVVSGLAEDLPGETGTFDSLVFTLVLCSVSDVDRALSEAFRVLKPGGRLVFLEHVRADSRRWAQVQDLLDATIWPPLVGGCHLGRDPVAAMRRAGFDVGRVEHYLTPRVPTPVSFHVSGAARRPL